MIAMFGTVVRMKITASVAISLLMLMAAVPAFADQSARLQASGDVLQSMVSLTPLPGVMYYGIGEGSNPRAVLGVYDGYRLESILWWPFDLSGDRGRVVQRSFVDVARLCATNPQGYEIVDGSGNGIGVWYSDRYNPIVSVGDDGTVKVIIPNRWVWTEDSF